MSLVANLETNLGVNPENNTPEIWSRDSLLRVLFLGTLMFVVFFISEHDPQMALVADFVTDIELQESWADGGNPLRRVGFLALAALGLIGMAFGKWGGFRLCVPVVLMAVYVVWCGATYTWSIDPPTTLRRFIVMLCCIVGCFGVSRYYQPREVIFSVVLAFGGFLLIAIAAEIYFGAFRPHHGGYRFAGTAHPNSQAAYLSMLCIALVTLAILDAKRRVIFLALLAVAFLFLFLTKSRTSALAMLFSLATIWFFQQSTRSLTLATALGTWAASFLVLLLLSTGIDPIADYYDVLMMGRAEETDGASLTGRMPLWQELASYIKHRPWQGHGFRAFWTARNINDIAETQEWVVSEAHSSYVEATLQVGLIGCLLMIAVAFATLWFAVVQYRITRQPEFLFIIGGVVFSVIRGFSESGLSGPTAFTSFLFVTMFAQRWNSSPDAIDLASDQPPNE